MAKIEKEAKFILDQQQYEHLLHHSLKSNFNIKSIFQKNIYYDSLKYHLEEAKNTFRIRIENDKAMVTLKILDVIDKNNVRNSYEYHNPVEDVLYLRPIQYPDIIKVDDLADPYYTHLNILGIKELYMIGIMINYRKVIQLNAGTIEVDTAFLPDSTSFHEIEIENEDEDVIANILSELITIIGPLNPSFISKYQRFLL